MADQPILADKSTDVVRRLVARDMDVVNNEIAELVANNYRGQKLDDLLRRRVLLNDAYDEICAIGRWHRHRRDAYQGRRS